MNLALLDQMILEKYVRRQSHPDEDLFIYNYTAKAQYDRVWNECTLQCRGLILDGKGEIIARPFRKFFNLGEHENQPIPKEPFEVYDKMDGSLGILFWLDNEPVIATRGSFVSDQAVKANQMLKSIYTEAVKKLDKDCTYLFEIIYPENRIVVDYGDEEQLVLLAVLNTHTGDEMALKEMGFPVVKKYDGIKDIHTLKLKEELNKEGFVIRFQSGFRLKVKFDEYQRIHRIITNVSSISIWEYLKEGKSWDDILERVPDEFYNWVKETKQNLIYQFESIMSQANEEYRELDTRKETALYFKSCKYPYVMFNMLDGKSVDPVIWKMIRPAHEKPFMNEEEETI